MGVVIMAGGVGIKGLVEMTPGRTLAGTCRENQSTLTEYYTNRDINILKLTAYSDTVQIIKKFDELAGELFLRSLNELQ